MSIKWGVNSYCTCLQVRQEGSAWLHTNENTFTYSGNKVTYQINIVTYRQEIVTYWNLCCYRPQINKGFQAISCFYASVTLLPWNAIKWGFRSYIPMKILLHTPEIFLHTDRIFLHTIWKLLHTRKLFFSAFPWWLETVWKQGFQSFQKYSLRKLWIYFLSSDLNKIL